MRTESDDLTSETSVLTRSRYPAESCAELLGHYETNYGDFRLAFDGLKRLERVTPDDVKRVAATRLRAANRTVVTARAPS